MRNARATALSIAFLAAWTTIFWARLISGGTPYERDLGFFFAPLWACFRAVIAAGSAPMWNPWIGGGVPMAADPNNAVFFPATLAHLLAPTSLAVRVNVVLWAAALGFGFFAGLRRMGVSLIAAATVGAAAVCCGPASSLVSYPTSAWTLALFVPLAAATSEAGRGKRSASMAAAVLAGLVLLAGEPAIAAEVGGASVIFLWDGSAGRAVRGGALVAAGALLTAAAQIVPALALLPQTVRLNGFSAEMGPAFYSVRPLRLAAFVFPNLFGDVHSPQSWGFWGRDFFDAGSPYVGSLALGTVALLLVPAALADRRGRRFVLLAGVAAVASFGRFLPGGTAILSLPGMSMVRYPEKSLLVASFSILAAAAFGLDAVRRDARARRIVAVSGFALCAASISLAAALTWAPAASFRALVRARIASSEFASHGPAILAAIRADAATSAVFALVAALACLMLLAPPRRRLLGPVLAAALLLDLLPRTWNAAPLAPAATLDAPPPAAVSARERGGRLYFDRESQIALDPLRPMVPALWGVPLFGNNDIDRFSPRRSFLFGLLLSRMPIDASRKLALLRAADVSMVSGLTDEISRTEAEPIGETSPGRCLAALAGARRLRLVARARLVSSEPDVWGRFLDPGLDLESTAMVESRLPPLPPDGGGDVRIAFRRPDREALEISAAQPRILVRSETFDPRWRATIDGIPASLFPADYAFQGVLVPGGRHRVEIRYSDPAAAAAMAVSLAALLAGAGAGASLVRRRRGASPGTAIG